MVRPSKKSAAAALRVEDAVKPGHDEPQDQQGRGDQRKQKEHQQHEPPSR